MDTLKSLSKNHPYVVVPHGATVELAKKFKVSRQTVSAALNFKTINELSDKIRTSAIKDYFGYRIKPKQ